MATPTPILIVGPERSGTSLVAQLVHAWGAFAGEESLLSPADERNPRGYWEYTPLWDLFEEVGEFGTGRSWWEADFSDLVLAKAKDPVVAARATALVRDMAREGRPWMWKDPALCHFLGFWKVLLPEAVFVCTVRDPGDVAVSWQRFGTWLGLPAKSLRCNLLRWQHLWLTVLRETAGCRALFVEYERLVESPEAEARRLAAFLDSTTGVRSDRSTVDAMASHVDAALWRNRDSEAPPLSAAQHRLYDLLRCRARDEPVGDDLDDLAPPDGWRHEVLADEAATRPAGADGASSGLGGRTSGVEEAGVADLGGVLHELDVDPRDDVGERPAGHRPARPF